MINFRPLTIRGKYAFFWRQWPSNWFLSPFSLDGSYYNCVEQWMMAEKARVFNDLEIRQQILGEKHPAEQKKLGRMVKNYDEETWGELRYEIVLRGTIEKYKQNEKLKKQLIDTGELILVEASPVDKIWGIGLSEEDPLIGEEKNWRGENLLGKVIMEAREKIKSTT